MFVCVCLHYTGFRLRWLLESYLGLKHVPFEHFACSPKCARRLNDSFHQIQSRLRKQHDEAYQSMLDRYADSSGGVVGGAGPKRGCPRQPRQRGRSLLGGRREKQLEIREMWGSELGDWGVYDGGFSWPPGAITYSRHILRHHRHCGHAHQTRRDAGSSCSIM